jgi:hypothetical protein
MEEEAIKEAFRKVKQDFQFLLSELNSLKSQLSTLSHEILSLKNLQISAPILLPAHQPETPTISAQIPTQNAIPTDEWPYYALKPSFMQVSTGNEGVPTDRQTNRQTDNRHIFRTSSNTKQDKQDKDIPINHLEKAKEILDSLDSLKKEVRIKFKKLTEQEMHVFSLLYQLDDEGELVDYPFLASKTGLSESSIRDYIRKISLKGIPIQKEKLNNKKILLHVSQDLKKIATLDTILKLRDL